MRTMVRTVFVVTTAVLALGRAAGATTKSGPLLLVQGSEMGGILDPEHTIFFASLVIGNDHTLTVISGTDPGTSVVFAGTIKQEDFDQLLAAMGALHIGIQPSCTGLVLEGLLPLDDSLGTWRIAWLGPRRAHTFTVSEGSGSPVCSPAVADLIAALGRIVFDVEGDPTTVIIH